jgi:hypothetical protein
MMALDRDDVKWDGAVSTPSGVWVAADEGLASA